MILSPSEIFGVHSGLRCVHLGVLTSEGSSFTVHSFTVVLLLTKGASCRSSWLWARLEIAPVTSGFHLHTPLFARNGVFIHVECLLLPLSVGWYRGLKKWANLQVLAL